MKKLLLVLAIALLLLPALARAAEGNLGLLKPDSAFYFIQGWGEGIKSTFTFDREKKADYLLELSDRRSAEIESYADKIDSEKLAGISENYQKVYSDLETQVTKLNNREQYENKIAEMNIRQQKALQTVYDRVPENAKAAIKNAQLNSSKYINDILASNPELLTSYGTDSQAAIEGKIRAQVETEVRSQAETQARTQAESQAASTAAATENAVRTQAEAQARAQAEAAAKSGQYSGQEQQPTQAQIDAIKKQYGY